MSNNHGDIVIEAPAGYKWDEGTLTKITYVAEEAERRGWDGPLLALFEQMKKERYMFTEPVDGHWDGHITRDNVDRFKHPIHVTPGSRLERLT